SGLIRLIDSGNKVSTVMGSGPGYIDGIGRNTAFNAPSHLAFDPSNNTILYITDRGNKVIRKVLIE
ncbi:MAG TPA: hypothetical protein VLB84_05315, partial [Bacteroidia bacterium]|nr:hypothetical protein [Bacteroidia bacterium]